MQANFPYRASAIKSNNMHSFKNSSTPFFSSSYSNESQVPSNTGENLNSTIVENSKTYEELWYKLCILLCKAYIVLQALNCRKSLVKVSPFRTAFNFKPENYTGSTLLHRSRLTVILRNILEN